MEFPDYVPLAQASQALQALSQAGGLEFTTAFSEHFASGDEENQDPQALKATKATRKKRVLLPWVPVASFCGAEAEVGIAETLAELFPGGQIPGQSYGNGCVKTTEYKCCEVNRCLCDFKVRTRTDTRTGNVAIQQVGSHNHEQDLSLRGLKRSVKDFIWPYLGTRSMKPKHIYELVVASDDIPANDKPTLAVSFRIHSLLL